MIRGVRAVVNRIDVKGLTHRTDEAIKADIVTTYKLTPGVDADEIGVAVNEGVVTLAGKVELYSERTLARRLAGAIKGVRGVDNKIEVKFTQSRTDAAIKMEVERGLRLDPRIDENLIAVTVKGGVVTLHGAVFSAAAKSRAEAQGWVAGVRHVDVDKVAVKFPGDEVVIVRRPVVVDKNEAIEDALEAVLTREPTVLARGVDVEIIEGVAHLRGVVTTLQQRRAAGEIAEDTSGVRGVKNDLVVRSPQPPADAELAAAVRAALMRDPVVDRFEVAVTAEKGVATLQGNVELHIERRRAEHTAEAIPGVVAVVNAIKVTQADKSDLALRRAIETQLNLNPYVNSRAVVVRVVDGIASLSGVVRDERAYRTARAVALASGVDRVVTENLRID